MCSVYKTPSKIKIIERTRPDIHNACRLEIPTFSHGCRVCSAWMHRRNSIFLSASWEKVHCHLSYPLHFWAFFYLFYCKILFVRGPRIIMSCQCLWKNVTIHSCFLFYAFEPLYLISFHLSLFITFLHICICNNSRKTALTPGRQSHPSRIWTDTFSKP